MKVFNATLLVLVCSVLVQADINWPEYSQQCRDDAGPPYMDDAETFPGGKYHDGSAAYPVLNGNECAGPLRQACQDRPTYKTAYLEGPISCGGNGWYCRIFNDEVNGWDNVALNSDVNFGQCNSEEAFEDPGYDQDGHCHGSSDDSTYYWWIRDHWYRQYNGRVRCCCGWYQGGSQPLFSRRIANRCDYRRLVTSTEDLEDCRDANEGHGLGFEDGCDSQYSDQIGQELVEDDGVCWEIERFGYTEEEYSIPTLDPAAPPITPSPVAATPPPTNAPSNAPTSPTPPPTPAPVITPAPVVVVTTSPTPAPVLDTNSPTPAPVDNEGPIDGAECGNNPDEEIELWNWRRDVMLFKDCRWLNQGNLNSDGEYKRAVKYCETTDYLRGDEDDVLVWEICSDQCAFMTNCP